MLFSNQKIFFDVRDYSKVDRLEADICQLGGVIEKFLSKEITCVVTNRAKTESLSVKKDVPGTASAHAQTSLCGSRVLSRGQSLLMRSNSLKDTSVCDPVAFAQMWDIRVVNLDTVIRAIDRQQQQTLNPSSSSAKHFTKLHYHTKRRKFPDKFAQDKERNSRPSVTKLSGAFVKFEDTESNFRPFFKQYLTFPSLVLGGDLSTGLFKCAENVRPTAAKKMITTAAGTKKQKAWSKRGYCECCDTMYDDLNQHLNGEDHRRFAECVENFANLDKLIDQISSCGIDSLSLPVEDDCTHYVATETSSAEETDRMQVSSDNHLCTADLEPVFCHRSLLVENHSTDRHGEHQMSDNAVQNGERNDKITGEQTKISVRSPVCITASDTESYSMESEKQLADDDVDKISERSETSTLQMTGNTLPTSAVITESGSSHTVVASCKEKSRSIFVGGSANHSEDMPEYISSEYVVNLLELLSSENSVHSPLCAEETGSGLVEACENHSTVTSVELPCVPSPSSNHAVNSELLPREPEHCSDQEIVSHECHFPLTGTQNDLSAAPNTAVTLEYNNPNTDRSRTGCKHVSELVTLSSCSNVPTPSALESVAVDDILLIPSDEMDHSDLRSCNTNADGSDASVLMPSEAYLPPTTVDQPATCPNVITSESCCPQIYGAYLPFASVDQPATCPTVTTSESCLPQIYGAFMLDDLAFLPIQSDLNADNFDLHDQLLTMAHTSDIAEHHKQPSCSSTRASTDAIDACGNSNNNNNLVTTVNSNLCLQMASDPLLCFSESYGQPAESSDDSISTPVHSRSNSFENLSTYNDTSARCLPRQNDSFENVSTYNGTSARCVPFCRNDSSENLATYNGTSARCIPFCRNDLSENLSTYNGTSARCMPFCQRSPVSGLGLLAGFNCTDVCLENALTNDRLEGSAEMNAVSSERQYMQRVRQKSDSHVTETSATEITSDMTEKRMSVHGLEGCDKSTSADLVQLEMRLADNNISDSTKSFVDDLGFTVNAHLTSLLQPEVNNSSDVRPDSFDNTEPVEEADTDDNSASTMIYECDFPTSSAQECTSDKCCTDKSETTADCVELSPVSGAKSTWRVISCVDCRMRLVRTEVNFSVLPAQNDAEINCKSSVLGRESGSTSKLLDKMDALSDGMSAMVISDECGNLPVRQQHANDENETETTVDQREPGNLTWEVRRSVGCRMRLSRSKVDFPAQTVLSDSRQGCANNSCDLESKQFLS